jgi:hypothetical protein
MLKVVESQWCNPREVGICSAANEVGEIGKTIDKLEEIFVARLLQCLHANDQYSCPSIGVAVWISCLVLTQQPVEPRQRTPLFGNTMVFPGPKVPHVRFQTSVWQWRRARAFLCRNSAPNPCCGPRGGHGCLPGFGRRANNAGPSKSASRSGLSIDMCTEGSFHPVPMGSHANL